MSAETTTLTLAPTFDSESNARPREPMTKCNCSDYLLDKKCKHTKVLLDEEILFRLNCLLLRDIRSFFIELQQKNWSYIRVESIREDNVCVYQMFLRSYLESIIRKSVTALVHKRGARKKMVIKQRIGCMCCNGTAPNREICNYEKECIDYIMENSNSGTCEEQENGPHMLNEIESIFPAKQLENDKITSYCSSLPRFFSTVMKKSNFF